MKIVEHMMGKATNHIAGGITEGDVIPWLEASVSEMFRNDSEACIKKINEQPGRRYFKTHSCIGMLKPPSDTTKKLKIIDRYCPMVMTFFYVIAFINFAPLRQCRRA